MGASVFTTKRWQPQDARCALAHPPPQVGSIGNRHVGHGTAGSKVADIRSVCENIHPAVPLDHLDSLCAGRKSSDLLTIYDDLVRPKDNLFARDLYLWVKRTNLPRIPNGFRVRRRLDDTFIGYYCACFMDRLGQGRLSTAAQTSEAQHSTQEVGSRG